ncbi:MAG: UPF0280 family protein [Prolixibacteraceae bacterium]|nr:UPF0280 family protein [Prolixibacteraceae bacterium]
MNPENQQKNRGVESRFYRSGMGQGRFNSFVVGYKDSDLWIGINPESFRDDIPLFAQQQLISLRKELEAYILSNPNFASTFYPVEISTSAPGIAREMAGAAKKAETGPMAAVAGAFSEYIGKAILSEFKVKEVVVENGGDLFLSLKKDLVLSIYAGESPLSGKVGIEIPASETPLGICTSAGTVGPSKSFGKADAVMVACKNTLLADAWATALGNLVKTAGDIDITLEYAHKQAEILSLVIICDGKVGVRGTFELKPF